jgi:hypothetical protein
MPERYCWSGTVAVYFSKSAYSANYDPEHSAFWGQLFLYGDPAIIRSLMEHYP